MKKAKQIPHEMRFYGLTLRGTITVGDTEGHDEVPNGTRELPPSADLSSVYVSRGIIELTGKEVSELESMLLENWLTGGEA